MDLAPSPLLEPLRLPLVYAQRPGAVARVRGLHQTLRAAAGRLAPQLPPPLQAPLEAVVDALAGFDTLDASARIHAVERASEALAQLGALLTATPQALPQPMAAPLLPPEPAAAPAPRLRARATRVPVGREDVSEMDVLALSVACLPGVGPKVAASLEAKSIRTLADLLRTIPRAYEDRSTVLPIASVEPGARALLQGVVRSAGPSGFGRQRRWEVQMADASGVVRLTWFRFNGAQMLKRMPVGCHLLAAGPVTRFGSLKQVVHPEVTVLADRALADPGGIVPIYPEIEGVHRLRLRKLVTAALQRIHGAIPEVLPLQALAAQDLPSLEEALWAIHAPPPNADVERLTLKDTAAHRRLAFEEFFVMQVALAQRRAGQARLPALTVNPGCTPQALIQELFPFPPTGAQSRVVAEIMADLARGEPMARLLQGDVGSGKTAVAAAACLAVVKTGAQAAVVAPTEILAEQHLRNLTRMLAPRGITPEILTGSVVGRERASILARLAQGVTQVVVGTHALLQEGVAFRKLALACVDEQHRFGVEQRHALRQKGPAYQGQVAVPHLLAMTATPIPRTLALTLYGDLDISVLDQMPPGRKPVVTRVVTGRNRTAALAAVEKALAAGRQAYVVYPLVEESENSDLQDATQGAVEMRAVFPGRTVELLHGRMKSAEKDAAMGRFMRRQADILVSTTVIEVGVDVPNATVMWIEHAERFGLSQLHQLRGRVGRGADQSHCYLVVRGGGSEDAKRRVQVMADTHDGFRIAEEDLAIRGPGDFLGTRQSGAPPLMYANLLRHGAMMEEARAHARAVLATDPGLQLPEHAALKRALEQRYQSRLELAGSG